MDSLLAPPYLVVFLEARYPMKHWLLWVFLASFCVGTYLAAETLQLRLTDHQLICTVPLGARQIQAGIAPYFDSERTLTDRDFRHQSFDIPPFQCDDPNDEVVAYCAIPGTLVKQPVPCFRVGRTD